MYVRKKDTSLNPHCSTLEPDQQKQHNRHTACVIAQQYSSATSVSLRLHSRKEKLGSPRPEDATISTFFLLTLKISLSLQWRNSKSRKSGTVCIFSFSNATTCPLWTSWSPLPVVVEV
jgi:hypothetical protein